MALARRRWSSDEGYTLLETVVAMALFLSVLIPLMIVIGNFVRDRSPEELREAVRIAQSEMSRIEEHQTVPRGSRTQHGRYILYLSIYDTSGVRTVALRVAPRRDSMRVILSLQKTLLPHERR